ncbi:hypothetical protein ACTJJ7_10010 [Phyllobacterium sp. 22229]|uniref:hypothetical protein n=1 Tax=Phyllobacterium sp. 22229 TaxID=3453895 RepID=UPI003F83CC05
MSSYDLARRAEDYRKDERERTLPTSRPEYLREDMTRALGIFNLRRWLPRDLAHWKSQLPANFAYLPIDMHSFSFSYSIQKNESESLSYVPSAAAR